MIRDKTIIHVMKNPTVGAANCKIDLMKNLLKQEEKHTIISIKNEFCRPTIAWWASVDPTKTETINNRFVPSFQTFYSVQGSKLL